jgi:hypothetical protein
MSIEFGPAAAVPTTPLGSSAQSPFALSRRWVPTQLPLEHWSTRVHCEPSSHGVPFGWSDSWQPSVGLQLETLQGFDGGGQTTVLPRLHVPAPSQFSPDVHAFWSLHVVPEGAKGFEHCPDAGLQLPAR